MTSKKLKILLVFNQKVRDKYILDSDLKRLSKFATWEWLNLEGGNHFESNDSPEAIRHIKDKVSDKDCIVVCHGSPAINKDVIDKATNLKFIGELEGDRFANRIDLKTAWESGIKTVDTTHGSSYPVAEWALALILISLRNAGGYFKRILQSDTRRSSEKDFGYINGELTGKRVGLIGCGHIGRLLIKFLRPFDVDIKVYDPYLASEIPNALGFVKTSIDNVLSHSQVIVCLAPLTPATRNMLGKEEFELIKPNSVFINVSRGAIVDSQALISRLKKGDMVAGLDVFDPEPIPPDSEIIKLDNVFLTPHIAGVTASGYPRFFTLMVDELERFAQGHDPMFELNSRSIANRNGITQDIN